MNTHNGPTQNDIDTEAVHGRIAEALTPLALPAERAHLLQQRLAARIAQSTERHRGLRTIRRGDAPWQTLARGVRACVLHDNGATRSAMVEFAPGSHLPSHRHAAHEECIVLRGSLQAGDCHVGLHDYHLAPAGSRHGSIQSQEGAVAFLRGTSIGNAGDMMREITSAALPGDGPRLSTIGASDEGWREVAEGVFVKPLWQQDASASMLLRLNAGARAPAYLHAVDEERLLLSGEVFFGDILLRNGEYQMAPRGTAHGEVFSDTGALLYVHGDAAYAQLG
ncbi:MAG TPA: cupin domain-containing protein [Burkholderiales bacterium]|nr:cupin domain-containing protein [Burkholderiales bacterium]